jgi:hypothetical protein
VPALSGYFGLVRDPAAFFAVALALPPWFFTLRTIWRHNLLERVLGLHDSPTAVRD